MLEYMTYGSGGIFTFRVAPPYVRQLLDEPLKKWITYTRGRHSGYVRTIGLETKRATILETFIIERIKVKPYTEVLCLNGRKV